MADQRTPAAVEGTPAQPDPTTAPEATPAAAPPGPVELPFRLEDVEDQAARNYLAAREAQMRQGYESAVTKARERERELQGRVTVLDQIEDEATRREALQEFLAQYDVDIEFEDPVAQPTPGYPAAELDPNDPIQQRVLALEAEAEAQRETAAQRTKAEQDQARVRHADATLAKFAKTHGFGETGEQVPAAHRDAIIEIAVTRGVQDNGLFDMDAAVTEHLARLAVYTDGATAKYRQTKDTPQIVIGGDSADNRVDLTTTEGRLKQANLIAQRHATR